VTITNTYIPVTLPNLENSMAATLNGKTGTFSYAPILKQKDSSQHTGPGTAGFDIEINTKIYHKLLALCRKGTAATYVTKAANFNGWEATRCRVYLTAMRASQNNASVLYANSSSSFDTCTVPTCPDTWTALNAFVAKWLTTTQTSPRMKKRKLTDFWIPSRRKYTTPFMRIAPTNSLMVNSHLRKQSNCTPTAVFSATPTSSSKISILTRKKLSTTTLVLDERATQEKDQDADELNTARLEVGGEHATPHLIPPPDPGQQARAKEREKITNVATKGNHSPALPKVVEIQAIESRQATDNLPLKTLVAIAVAITLHVTVTNDKMMKQGNRANNHTNKPTSIFRSKKIQCCSLSL
jgi:hypothetical protein